MEYRDSPIYNEDHCLIYSERTESDGGADVSSDEYNNFDNTAYLAISGVSSRDSTRPKIARNRLNQGKEEPYRRRHSFIQNMKNSGGAFVNYTTFSKRHGTIFVCVGVFLLYFLIGSVAFSFCFKRWGILDSLYYIVVTFTSCGYGDLTPEGDAEMIFATIYLLVGIAVVATVAFGIVFENVFDAYDHVIGKAKEKSTRNFIEKVASTRLCDGKHDDLSEQFRENMRNQLYSMLPVIILLICGSLVIGNFEGWRPVKSIYFLSATATTVCYGDVVPESEEMKAFCLLFLPFAVGATAEILTRITGVYLTYFAERTENEFMSRKLTCDDIKKMDIDGDGSVSNVEFMRFMLISMGKLSSEDWDKLQAVFKKLDSSKDGLLTMDDLILAANS